MSTVRQRGELDPSKGTWYRSKLVDQASRCPTFLAVKTTYFESGEKDVSSNPPKGFEGQSASISGIRSRHFSGLPTGTAKRWERLPSAQKSQCPHKTGFHKAARFYRLPLFRTAVQRSLPDSYPGKTSMETSRVFPSGEISIPPRSRGKSVSWVASPLSGRIFHTW